VRFVERDLDEVLGHAVPGVQRLELSGQFPVGALRIIAHVVLPHGHQMIDEEAVHADRFAPVARLLLGQRALADVDAVEHDQLRTAGPRRRAHAQRRQHPSDPSRVFFHEMTTEA
jgi:hypothetical protein